MNRLLLSVWTLLFTAVACAAEPAEKPFDTLQRLYQPYTEAGDGLAFPLKIKAISSDPYKFWRGAKDLFFIWAKTGCSDWLNERSAYTPVHADIHFSNIGLYPVAGPWGRTAFGLVDFDDAATLPFQFDLLEGLISIRLAAEQNGVRLSAAERTQLASALIEGFRTGIESHSDTVDLLADNAAVRKLSAAADVPYKNELKETTTDGKFRRAVYSSKGKLKEIYRPTTCPSELFAQGLADALTHAPATAKLFRFTSANDFHAALLDSAQRIKFSSGGSQGLKKYCLLLRRPLQGIDSDVVIYLKQQIPAAAERAQIIPRDTRPPGQRAAQDVDALTSPHPLINSWCDIAGESYLVSLKDPWGGELLSEDMTTAGAALDSAKLFGTVAGAAQRHSASAPTMSADLTPALQAALEARTVGYLAQLQIDFRLFKSDPRVHNAERAADVALAAVAP